MRTIAILPVKRFEHAKSRLDEVEPPVREKLAEAMLEDVLAALGEVGGLEAVMVVSGEPRARRLAKAAGASVVTDDEEAGQSAAAELGLRRAVELGFDRALLVPGDCPALDPVEVDDLLASAAPPPAVTIVPDRHMTGTNALLLDPDGPFRPAFGPGSLRRHLERARLCGVPAAVRALRSLALDVDTPDDLAVLLRPREDWPVGPRTHLVVERDRAAPAESRAGST